MKLDKLLGIENIFTIIATVFLLGFILLNTGITGFSIYNFVDSENKSISIPVENNITIPIQENITEEIIENETILIPIEENISIPINKTAGGFDITTPTSESTNITNTSLYFPISLNQSYNVQGNDTYGGFLEIATTNITDCITISSPGDYHLNESISNSETNSCISITANNVLLDCLGNIIDGNGSSKKGIHISRVVSTNVNITVQNCTLTDWDSSAISLRKVDNVTLKNLNVSRNPLYGISLSFSNYNTIINNIANNQSGYSGINLYSSSYNNITGNTIERNSNGLQIEQKSYYNEVHENIISSNLLDGIILSHDANHTTIVNNTVSNNVRYGIFLIFSSNQTIYDNIFNNSVNFHFFISSLGNDWNTTLTLGTINILGNKVLGGNYWATPTGDGHSETCNDTNRNGICDENYTLDTNNIDYLPLSTYTLTNSFTNPANQTNIEQYENITINITITGETDLSSYTLEWNNSGYLDKISTASISGTTWNANVSLNVTADPGQAVWWRYYACDTDNNCSMSNNYSFTVQHTYNLFRCYNITGPGSYTLTTDVLDATSSKCINIKSNNLIFDCLGNTIDGDDVADYGVYIKRDMVENTNITVQNCNITDWYTANIYLENAANNAFNNLNTSLSGDGIGIYLYPYSENNTFNNIRAYSNIIGMYVDYGSHYSSISNSLIYNNTDGITIASSDYLNLENVTSELNSDNGIYFLEHVDNSNLTNVTLRHNSGQGIRMDDSDSNIIKDSHIQNNTNQGILLYGNSQDNFIYNNFLNNTINALFSGSNNFNNWNTTLATGTENIIQRNVLGGNYWATPNGNGHSETCNDTNRNGICDENYTLDTNNIDYLPLYDNPICGDGICEGTESHSNCAADCAAPPDDGSGGSNPAIPPPSEEPEEPSEEEPVEEIPSEEPPSDDILEDIIEDIPDIEDTLTYITGDSSYEKPEIKIIFENNTLTTNLDDKTTIGLTILNNTPKIDLTFKLKQPATPHIEKPRTYYIWIIELLWLLLLLLLIAYLIYKNTKKIIKLKLGKVKLKVSIPHREISEQGRKLTLKTDRYILKQFTYLTQTLSSILNFLIKEKRRILFNITQFTNEITLTKRETQRHIAEDVRITFDKIKETERENVRSIKQTYFNFTAFVVGLEKSVLNTIKGIFIQSGITLSNIYLNTIKLISSLLITISYIISHIFLIIYYTIISFTTLILINISKSFLLLISFILKEKRRIIRNIQHLFHKITLTEKKIKIQTGKDIQLTLNTFKKVERREIRIIKRIYSNLINFIIKDIKLSLNLIIKLFGGLYLLTTKFFNTLILIINLSRKLYSLIIGLYYKLTIVSYIAYTSIIKTTKKETILTKKLIKDIEIFIKQSVKEELEERHHDKILANIKYLLPYFNAEIEKGNYKKIIPELDLTIRAFYKLPERLQIDIIKQQLTRQSKAVTVGLLLDKTTGHLDKDINKLKKRLSQIISYGYIPKGVIEDKFNRYLTYYTIKKYKEYYTKVLAGLTKYIDNKRLNKAIKEYGRLVIIHDELLKYEGVDKKELVSELRKQQDKLHMLFLKEEASSEFKDKEIKPEFEKIKLVKPIKEQISPTEKHFNKRFIEIKQLLKSKKLDLAMRHYKHLIAFYNSIKNVLLMEEKLRMYSKIKDIRDKIIFKELELKAKEKPKREDTKPKYKKIKIKKSKVIKQEKDPIIKKFDKGLLRIKKLLKKDKNEQASEKYYELVEYYNSVEEFESRDDKIIMYDNLLKLNEEIKMNKVKQLVSEKIEQKNPKPEYEKIEIKHLLIKITKTKVERLIESIEKSLKKKDLKKANHDYKELVKYYHKVKLNKSLEGNKQLYKEIIRLRDLIILETMKKQLD